MDALMQLKESLSERYDIKREIGAGGMATVYLAQDLRHDRPVALKLLNPELGAVLGVERFLAEIRVTANLQHPNLLPLFDSGATNGLLYYVMPFVEGESLRARLEREKQLPVDEAVRMTVAIANALDYAHSHGVIHRDLKPENILLQAGQPVIADFGIALAVSNAGGSRITQTGLSLGTPQYMSPEQATGDRVIDGRSDIYSLGALAYEMLTGDPPHTGSTSQAIIARMLTEKPRSMRASRSAISEDVEFAVQHSLEKLPADRFSTAREFADAIQGKGAHHTAAIEQVTRTANRSVTMNWKSRARDPITMGTGFLAMAAIAVAAFSINATRNASVRPVSPVVRYVIWAPDSSRPSGNYPWPGAISPDGGTVVYTPANSRGFVALRTNQLEARPIPGTDDAAQAIFSPDGQWVAFESAGKLRKVRLDGSSPVTVSDGNAYNGADWTSRDEIILGSEGSRRGLSRVNANGGELTEFVKPNAAKGETDYLWPIAAPDGKFAVFAVWSGSLASASLASVSIEGGTVNYLGVKGIRPLAILDRTVIYLQADGVVMAIKLSRAAKKTDGPALPVHDPVYIAPGVNGNSEIFVSHGGALLTSRGGTSSRLAWIAKDGSTTPVFNDIRTFGAPRLSPDAKSIAVPVDDHGKVDIWIYDIPGRTFSGLTSTKGATTPKWSADGTKLFYVGLADSDRFAIFSQSADGGTQAQRIVDTPGPTTGLTIAADGKSIVYSAYSGNSWNLFRVPLDTAAVSRPFLAETSNETGPAFSPDGKWIAMTSDQSGRNEVFIRSYPNPSSRLQISAGGGSEPVWSRDGKRIYYRAGTVALAATLATSPSVRVIARDTLLTDVGSILTSGNGVGYDVAQDGRFLGRLTSRDDYQLVVVPNWRTELDQRLASAVRR
jgi:eukaryotic-like serine/threonine-protein kinase